MKIRNRNMPGSLLLRLPAIWALILGYELLKSLLLADSTRLPFYLAITGVSILIWLGGIYFLLRRQRVLNQTSVCEASQTQEQLTERTVELERLTRQLERQVEERERIEAELASERSLLRTVIDNLPDYIFVKDRESRFVIGNLSVAQGVGVSSPHDLLGKRDFDFSPPEIAEAFYADEQAIMDSGKPLLDHEEINTTYSGARRWFSTTKVPLHSNGEIIGIVGMSRDITLRKQHEAALQKAHDELEERIVERTAELVEANKILREEITRRQKTEKVLAAERNLLRTLIDNLPHYIYIKDAESRFVASNTAHVQGLGVRSEAELIGKTDYEFYSQELADKYHRDDLTVVQTGQSLINIEERARDKNGDLIWILTSKLPFRDPQGQVTGLVGIGINITEHKQTEERHLELAVERKRAEVLKELISNFSHDLKTPLSVINTSLYLLEKSSEPEYQQAKIANIKGQVKHLEKLIHDILMISQLDHSYQLELRPVDVNDLLHRIQMRFQSLIEGKHLLFQLDLDANLPPILADVEDLERALGNVVENAVKYTLDEGKVSVRTFTKAQHTLIEVIDTGIGIAEKDLPYIFDHFYRADMARSTETGGAGLGLAIAKKVIEQHHGSIEVESVAGKGSTFRVRLPVIA